MERTEIVSLYKNTPADGTVVTVCGWAKNIRDSKNIGFIALSDGGCFKTLQVVLESSANSFQLKQGDNAIAYEIKQGGSSLSAGSAVLSWTQGDEIPAAATLNLEVTGPIDGLPYGSYTDTLTFKATVN